MMKSLVATTLLLAASAVLADTLEEVRERGFLRCGVIEGSPGYSTVDDKGNRVGFDIDHCKTISAAVFGKVSIEFVPITPNTVFTLLQSGGIDIFPDGATWSFRRDTTMGLDFTGVYMWAGQGFVAPRPRSTRPPLMASSVVIIFTVMAGLR